MREIFADLHVHIGRSESGKPIKITAAKSLNFANIAKECADRKGIQIVGIIDCASPYVIEDIENFLRTGQAYEIEDGGIIYKDKVCILLGSEVETSEVGRNGKKGAAHNVCFFPHLDDIKAFSKEMSTHIKNITLSTQRSDISGYELIDIVEKNNGILIPAHCFTPFKSYYGNCGLVFKSNTSDVGQFIYQLFGSNGFVGFCIRTFNNIVKIQICQPIIIANSVFGHDSHDVFGYSQLSAEVEVQIPNGFIRHIVVNDVFSGLENFSDIVCYLVIVVGCNAFKLGHDIRPELYGFELFAIIEGRVAYGFECSGQHENFEIIASRACAGAYSHSVVENGVNSVLLLCGIGKQLISSVGQRAVKYAVFHKVSGAEIEAVGRLAVDGSGKLVQVFGMSEHAVAYRLNFFLSESKAFETGSVERSDAETNNIGQVD